MNEGYKSVNKMYQTLDVDDYPEIWDAYRSHNEWQHELMAEWYIDKLAIAIKEYDNDRYTLDHYRALAWQGLDVADPPHPIPITWENLSSTEKQRLLDLRQELIINSPIDCEL